MVELFVFNFKKNMGVVYNWFPVINNTHISLTENHLKIKEAYTG